MSEQIDPSLKINHQPLHILIVEDMVMMAHAMRDKLEMIRRKFPDAKTTIVGTWKDGIEVVSQVPHPDVVLLDLGLPDKEWRQAVADVDQFEKKSPVLIVTGHPEEKVKELLALANAPHIEVLRKDPGMWSKLIEFVSRAMSRHKTSSMDRISGNIRLLGEILREMTENAPTE